MNWNACTNLIRHRWSYSSSLRQTGRPSEWWCWSGWKMLPPGPWEHQRLKRINTLLRFTWQMSARKEKERWDQKPVKKLTGGVCASQRLTLLIVVDSIHMYEILCLWRQSSQSEVVPGRGQPLILPPPTTRLLIANAVSSDDRSWSQPVNSEGVGANVREVQASGRVQSWMIMYMIVNICLYMVWWNIIQIIGKKLK